ncbi:MAG: 16S rRNA (cytosine(1402)-N(4))-methyltransferase RsmH [Candidatus Omnitrophica bacterium]|nr:16S rRNA (cytosine(1402)-N(4))-methyltransferase RsmH [Candidatus Omnitrophota bacterium]
MHKSVMLEEVIKFLNPSAGKCVVDCTLGLGGHSIRIAQALGPQGRLIAIERDAESLKKAKENLKDYADRCDFINDDFRNIGRILPERGITEVDGFIFDLGISSFQLDDSRRGFSFQSEGPLDMRMNQNELVSAQDLVNSLTENELMKIFQEFGEERFSRRIARSIVFHRPITTTYQLRDCVLKALPMSYQRQRIHPATRTFQALRIAVNRELEALETALQQSIEFLRKGGRICVISFHSLEDRIVKNIFRSSVQTGKLQLILKKPLEPQESEIKENSRARSAKLRVAEKI